MILINGYVYSEYRFFWLFVYRLVIFFSAIRKLVIKIKIINLRIHMQPALTLGGLLEIIYLILGLHHSQEAIMPESPVMLITGASSGIGEATARLFGREGYQLVLAARRSGKLEEIANQIRSAGGQAIPVVTDVSRLEDVENLVRVTLENFSRIDLLYNNAGFGRLDWLENLDPISDIQAQIQVNLLGVIQTTRAVLPHMIAQRSGHIINMASVAGLVATPTYSVYAASKFAIRGFTQSLRREVGVWGIHVSGIYPGGVRTEFSQHAHIHRKTRTTTPAALRLEADHVARVILSVARRPRRSVILPWPLILGVWVNTLFPGFVDWVMERNFTRPERTVI
jgi:NADP-dependent 3-hydroxy acid dehydrogenase YdfG